MKIIIIELSPYLLHDHPDAILESARAFGNLSRSRQVREWMFQNKVDEIFVILIDHGKMQIVKAVCGVLVNLSAYDKHRKVLKTSGCVQRLLDALEFANDSLCEMIFKIFHNLRFVYQIKIDKKK